MEPRDIAQRYARHLVLKEIGLEGQKKLLSSSVLVVGAGALGSAALTYLACAGVGKLGICDGDRVELSNLQRQMIHGASSVGELKTVSARRRIAELAPWIETRLFDARLDEYNAAEILSGFDFVLDCTDSFESKFLVNDACVINGKPFCHGGAVRFGGQVMTCVPRRTPCLRCLLGGVPSRKESPSCQEVGVLGAVTGVIGSIQALEAIKYITGAGKPLLGRVLTFDGLASSARVTGPVGRDPGCAVCSDAPAFTELSQNSGDYHPRCGGQL